MTRLAVLVHICCFSLIFVCAFDGIHSKERTVSAAHKSPHQFNDTSLVWKAFVVTFDMVAALAEILWKIIVYVFNIIAVIFWNISVAVFKIFATITVNLWKISVSAFNIICVFLWKISMVLFNITATISVNLWKIGIYAFNIICDFLWKTSVAVFNIIATITATFWKLSADAINVVAVYLWKIVIDMLQYLTIALSPILLQGSVMIGYTIVFVVFTYIVITVISHGYRQQVRIKTTLVRSTSRCKYPVSYVYA